MKTLEKQQKCTMYNVQRTTNGNDQNRSSLRADEVGVAIQRRCSSSVIPKIDIPVISSERSDEKSAVCSVNVNNTPLSRAAFTLVELVITIAIVIILSVISVPIYRGYVDKAKKSEGYALLGAILSAQKAYYSEYGNFLVDGLGGVGWTHYDNILGIDARGNKYFTYFYTGGYNGVDKEKYYFYAGGLIPKDLRTNNYLSLILIYDITTGATLLEGSGY